MQVGALGGFGAAWVDDHQLGAALFPRRFDPLPDHRMAPCGVRSDEQDQVGFFQIAIGTGDDVFAKGAVVCGNRTCHAQAAVGVDIGRTDEALHQLVGDIIILGQQLAGDIEGNAVRPVFGDGGFETVGNMRQCRVPIDPRATDFRIEQAPLQPDGFAQMRAFGAEPTEIGGVAFVALDRGAAFAGCVWR